MSPPTVTQQNTTKNIIHPNTNFDTRSHLSTPFSSDTEADAKDLKRASNLNVSVSPIISTPETHRVARTIVRGDLASLGSDVDAGRKQRSYLVATDLSAEAAHALEWTIGTVLRDGDTLLAIYAIDEENIGEIDTQKTVPQTIDSSFANSSLLSTRRKSVDKGKYGRSNSSPARSNSVTRLDISDPGGERLQDPLDEASRSACREGSYPDDARVAEDSVREKSKSERERWVAAEQISTLVTKLLKKTKLQVNVIVEVIHCKSPKHLLTEMVCDHYFSKYLRRLLTSWRGTR